MYMVKGGSGSPRGYDIKKAKKNAEKIGVSVKPSTRKNKKLDVFKHDKKVASIGAKGYDDFTKHKDAKRKENYKARHNKYRHNKGTPSYFADKILWS